jgi:tetratricopeptide (TPR) repeat protein
MKNSPRSKAKAARKSPPSPAPARPLVPAWLLAGLLALVTLLLYWPALHHGFVNYDDDRYVTANVRVQNGLTFENICWAFANPVTDNWHPLTVLSHMLVCQFSGLNPWGHHLASVLLHAANAALVFLLLRQLTGATWRSLAVAALFAVHPLRVESVAWVAERKDVLSGFFGLLALIFYARYAQAQNAPRAGSFYFSGSYWLALFWFALGLMSKPMLVTWPFVMLLLDYWPLERFKPGSVKRLLLEKSPFFCLAAAVSVVTFMVQKQAALVQTIQNLSLAARCENALVSCCRYLGKMFWPEDLAVLYPYPAYWPVADVSLAAVFLTGLSVLLVVQRRRCPYLLMGWLWFLGTLIPVIGLVQVGVQSMADRYTYLPSLGVLIIVVWGAGALTHRWRHQAVLLAAAGSMAIVCCMSLTRTQLQYWQDSETLFRHTLAVTENNAIAHYDLSVALDEKGRRNEAIDEYRAVLKIQPGMARAHLNLGADLDKAGQADEAMLQYQEVIRLEPGNAKAHNNLGVALFGQGKTDEATKEFQDAARLAPDNAHIRNILATALYTQGRIDEAIQQFQEALRLQPDYAEAHFNLACVLAKRGQTDEAIKHFQEAVRLNPNYPGARERLAKLLQAPDKP